MSLYDYLRERKKKLPSEGRKLAEEHVDWFIQVVRPLLIEWFLHGHKHGSDLKEPQFINILDHKRMADEGDW